MDQPARRPQSEASEATREANRRAKPKRLLALDAGASCFRRGRPWADWKPVPRFARPLESLAHCPTGRPPRRWSKRVSPGPKPQPARGQPQQRPPVSGSEQAYTHPDCIPFACRDLRSRITHLAMEFFLHIVPPTTVCRFQAFSAFFCVALQPTCVGVTKCTLYRE